LPLEVLEALLQVMRGAGVGDIGLVTDPEQRP